MSRAREIIQEAESGSARSFLRKLSGQRPNWEFIQAYQDLRGRDTKWRWDDPLQKLVLYLEWEVDNKYSARIWSGKAPREVTVTIKDDQGRWAWEADSLDAAQDKALKLGTKAALQYSLGSVNETKSGEAYRFIKRLDVGPIPKTDRLMKVCHHNGWYASEEKLSAILFLLENPEEAQLINQSALGSLNLWIADLERKHINPENALIVGLKAIRSSMEIKQ